MNYRTTPMSVEEIAAAVSASVESVPDTVSICEWMKEQTKQLAAILAVLKQERTQTLPPEVIQCVWRSIHETPLTPVPSVPNSQADLYYAFVAAARRFAVERHGEQKYGTKPYVYHLEHVASVLHRFMPLSLSSQHRIHLEQAAYLHDLLEDTATTRDEIADSFGTAVAHIVWCVTDGEGQNRAARKRSMYRKCQGRKSATLLKLADRIANVEYSILTKNWTKVEKYRAELSEFSDNLYQPTSYAQDGWDHLGQLFTVYPADVRPEHA